MKNIVVTFHNVSNPIWFESTLNLISKFYKFGDMDLLNDVFEKEVKLKSTCFITFDDGEKSFYQVAYPILKRRKIPAAIFVSPKSILEEENFWFQNLRLAKKEILLDVLEYQFSVSKLVLQEYSLAALFKTFSIEKMNAIFSAYIKQDAVSLSIFQNINEIELHDVLASNIITIGAHTMNHPILQNETAENSSYEIEESINELEKLMGCKIHYFAYPNGTYGLDYGNREIDTLRSTSIKLAFSTDVGRVKFNDSPYKIKRIGLTTGSSLHVLAKLFLGNAWYFIKDNLSKKKSEKEQRFILKEMFK